MNSPEISIIMPIYNAANYLPQTIDDIRKQTFNDYELICVDDESSDNSAAIIAEFMKTDSRIQLIRQKKSNAGIARNTGMKHAKGNYLVFWDADDFFHADALEKLHRQITSVSADICICNADSVNSETGEHRNSDNYLKTHMVSSYTTYNRTDISEKFYEITSNHPWNKIYRASFIRENHLLFQDTPQANDTYFVMMALYLAQTITYIPDILISYRSGNTSSITGKASNTPLCAYQSYLYTLEHLETKKDYALIRKAFINRCIRGFFFSLNSQTEFDAYKQVYHKLVSEGFSRFGLETLPMEDFYQKWMYDDLHKMISLPAEEFLLQKAYQRRANYDSLSAKHKKLQHDFRTVNSELNHLKKRLSPILKIYHIFKK